jgi:hypothetical protein
MIDGPFAQFADELDELILRWQSKPLDDCLSVGEVVGALQFKAYNLMRQAQEDHEAT